MNIAGLASHPLRAVVQIRQLDARDLDLSVLDLVPVFREEADLVEGEIVGGHCGARPNSAT